MLHCNMKLVWQCCYALEPRLKAEALDSWFDAFPSREPVSTPDQVRGRLRSKTLLELVYFGRVVDFDCSGGRGERLQRADEVA
jgi:hypothetical protein